MTAQDRRRRLRVLAGLQLSHLLDSLRAPNGEPPDACRNQCGALGVDDRESWAKRRSCPCRSETA